MLNCKIIFQKTKGFTLIEIMVVIFILGVIFSIAVPSWINARNRSSIRTCTSQLRQIHYAKELWAMGVGKSSEDAPTMDELHPTYIKSEPTCPTGGDYDIRSLNLEPLCSIGGLHKLQ